MENSNKQIVSINNSLANFERQITIGEKLLGLKLSDSEREKIKKLLIEIVSNHYDIIQLISSYFPLTEELIKRFKDKLNWGGICSNDHLNWDEELITKYLEYINWTSLCNNSNIFWNEELIDKYFDFIDWNSISENPNIIWNEYLINKYINHLDLNGVFFSKNSSIKLTYNLYENFKDKIDIQNLSYVDFELPKEFIKNNIEVLEWKKMISFTKENLEFFQENIDYIMWDELSKNSELILTDDLIENFKRRWTWDEIIKIERKNDKPSYIRIFYIHYADGTYSNIFYNPDMVINEELLDSVNNDHVWGHFSKDISFKNNFSLIGKYESEWDWRYLSSNISIDWTLGSIEKYKNKIDWKFFSLNPNLPWSEELVELYYNYWDWKTLGMNSFLPWTIDFYKKYEHKFQEKFLFFHKEPTFYSDDFCKSNLTLNDYCFDHHYEKNILKEKFDVELIFYTKDILNWEIFSRKYDWSLYEIEKYNEYIDWSGLSRNRNINWSIELLKKYEDKWDWEGIGRNRLVVDFNLGSLIKYVNYVKENEDEDFSYRYPYIKFRNLFIKIVDDLNENDIVEIFENKENIKP